MNYKFLNSGNELFEEHRVDLETCPHCDYKMDWKKWNELTHTMCLEPQFYKPNYVSVTSECPNCFKNSWIHYDMEEICDYSYIWPANWFSKVNDRIKELKHNKGK